MRKTNPICDLKADPMGPAPATVCRPHPSCTPFPLPWLRLTSGAVWGYRIGSMRPRAGRARCNDFVRGVMRTVLIVEDDPAMLRGLEDNFKMKGYYVLTAVDGEKALATALKEKPDLILLDIMLPEMNGYEVCRRLHLDPRTARIPVIMLTAYTDANLNHVAFAAGARACIGKPFRHEALIALIEALRSAAASPAPHSPEAG